MKEKIKNYVVAVDKDTYRKLRKRREETKAPIGFQIYDLVNKSPDYRETENKENDK